MGVRIESRLAVLLAFAAVCRSVPGYTAWRSSEAILTYRFFVKIESPTEPSKEKVRARIERQVLHLFGPLIAGRFPAVPKGDHEVFDISRPVRDGKKGYRADYSFRGTLVVGEQAPTLYEILLPFDPEKIFRAGGARRGKNPCTDETYNEEDTFWYFWHPARAHCKLQEGIDYARIQGQIERLPNTTSTYPEYDRLVRGTGAKRKIVVSIFVGMDDPAKKVVDPMTSRDENAHGFRRMRRTLLEMGFVNDQRWSRRRLNEYLGVKLRGPFFVEEFGKDTPKGRLIARLYFGPTGLTEESRIFHRLYRDALLRSSVVVYDGHSGFGDSLYLDKIEEKEGVDIRLGPGYQIYYFNSCSSYFYYPSEYFARKVSKTDPKGTRNLDVLANGLMSANFAEHDANLGLVRAISDWAEGKRIVSYQTLMQEIDDKNFSGVLGDEDNPPFLP